MPNPVGPRKTRRTNQRLAYIRTRRPNALPNVKADSRYTPREVRRVKRTKRRIARREEAAKQRKAARQYNPLAPLTGRRERQELAAAEKLEFGPAESELRRATANQEQTAVNRAAYFDDYRQALREATARVNESNRQNVEAQEGRVDTAYSQDAQGLQARNAQAAEQAAKFGRPAPGSEEGAQALESRRTAGNESTGALRRQSAADTKYMELRGATAVLKKAEDQARQDAKAGQLRGEAKELAGKKGAFRTDLRRRTRQDERTYALARKEFGLKEKDLALKHKTSRADRKLEAQKLKTQRLVANIYASADKAGARAQVRVAKLNLQKGKISQRQYREIVNIYKGLPAKGKPGGAAGGGGAGGGGVGSGAGGSLAPWERDKVSNATRVLERNSASITDRATWMKRMQDAGVPKRLARIAWNKYVSKRQRQSSSTGGGPRGNGRL